MKLGIGGICEVVWIGYFPTYNSYFSINNQNFLFCNIHSWIVNETHRVSSHMLFAPLIKKKCVITALSPLGKLCGIFRKMSFNILNMNYRVVFLINFFSFLNENSFEIEKNLLQIKKKLSNKDWKIYQDHSDSSFIKFIIFDKDKKSNFCFIVSKIIRKKHCFNILNILYASNGQFIKNNWYSANNKILKSSNTIKIKNPQTTTIRSLSPD